jgi:hypothetical protein
MFELRRSGMSRAYKPLHDDNPHAAPTELVGVLGNFVYKHGTPTGLGKYPTVATAQIYYPFNLSNFINQAPEPSFFCGDSIVCSLKSNTTFVPCPAAVSIWIFPPCCSMIFLTLASPRPAPPDLVEKNGSKA